MRVSLQRLKFISWTSSGRFARLLCDSLELPLLEPFPAMVLMMEPNAPSSSHETLKHEVTRIWDRNADFWDEKMGEGNAFHKLLIEPAQLRLLNLKGGEVILDIACGNGQFARKMADLGAKVVAVDASGKMIDKATAIMGVLPSPSLRAPYPRLSAEHGGSAAKRCPRPSRRRGHRAAPQLAVRVPP